jgi:hypothetical protein
MSIKKSALSVAFALAAACAVGGAAGYKAGNQISQISHALLPSVNAKAVTAAATAPSGTGGTMPDGTVFAGVAVNRPLYTTPADAPGTYTGEDGAAKYCSTLTASGHQDWHVPTKDELNTLYENRNAGVLKGTFNETGSYPGGWYWNSSPPKFGFIGWAQRFSDGNQNHLHGRYGDASLRCVR